MRILSCSIDPSRSLYAEVQVPKGSKALSVTERKGIALAEEPRLLVNVGIPNDANQITDQTTMKIQIVTTGESDEDMEYLDSVFWYGSLFHIWAKVAKPVEKITFGDSNEPLPEGFRRVTDPKEATHVWDHDGRIVTLPGAYSRSLKAWMVKL